MIPTSGNSGKRFGIQRLLRRQAPTQNCCGKTIVTQEMRHDRNCVQTVWRENHLGQTIFASEQHA
jgi:hypothetical protein